LYLMGFRNHGAFHEECVARIGRDLVSLLDPEWLRVTGEFTPRGGIPFWPTFAYANQAGVYIPGVGDDHGTPMASPDAATEI
jgi:NADPH-dependent 7-cyano-7-deazaguanine reductase QueF